MFKINTHKSVLVQKSCVMLCYVPTTLHDGLLVFLRLLQIDLSEVPQVGILADQLEVLLGLEVGPQ